MLSLNILSRANLFEALGAPTVPKHQRAVSGEQMRGRIGERKGKIEKEVRIQPSKKDPTACLDGPLGCPPMFLC